LKSKQKKPEGEKLVVNNEMHNTTMRKNVGKVRKDYLASLCDDMIPLRRDDTNKLSHQKVGNSDGKR
jgi:hypothetical protein